MRSRWKVDQTWGLTMRSGVPAAYPHQQAGALPARSRLCRRRGAGLGWPAQPRMEEPIMSFRQALLRCALAAFLIGCAGAASTDQNDGPCLLTSGDEVFVSVSPYVSGRYMIDSQGYLTIPLVGEVKARGVTAPELGYQIEQTMGYPMLLVDPQVIPLTSHGCE
jgi:Polysaccharide biosynthesis/export protein